MRDVLLRRPLSPQAQVECHLCRHGRLAKSHGRLDVMDTANFSRELQLRFTNAFDNQVARVMEITSLDLLTLRCHAILEVALSDLLATRLMIDSDDSGISSLNFDRLTRLALAGFPPAAITLVSDFNKLRNYVAHHLDAAELEQRIATYLSHHPELGTAWPPADTPKERVWGRTLLRIATAVGVIPQLLAEFRRMQTEKPIETAGMNEPTFLNWAATSFDDSVKLR